MLAAQELAGSALASSVVFMFGRLPLIGMSCALDTLASQVTSMLKFGCILVYLKVLHPKLKVLFGVDIHRCIQYLAPWPFK